MSVVLGEFSCCSVVFFFFKQKTAYEMRISDWSSDVCSSDLHAVVAELHGGGGVRRQAEAGVDHQRHVGEVGAQGAQAVAVVEEIGRASCRERVCQYV